MSAEAEGQMKAAARSTRSTAIHSLLSLSVRPMPMPVPVPPSGWGTEIADVRCYGRWQHYALLVPMRCTGRAGRGLRPSRGGEY
eukprot:scaffold15992_cov118-Isochrysis_galbana.AAC.5